MVRCTVDNQALGCWEALYDVKIERPPPRKHVVLTSEPEQPCGPCRALAESARRNQLQESLRGVPRFTQQQMDALKARQLKDFPV